MEKNKKIDIKTGYEAMIRTLDNFYKLTEDKEGLMTFLGGGFYMSDDKPADSAFWEYWLDALKEVEEKGPLYLELSKNKVKKD